MNMKERGWPCLSSTVMTLQSGICISSPSSLLYYLYGLIAFCWLIDHDITWFVQLAKLQMQRGWCNHIHAVYSARSYGYSSSCRLDSGWLHASNFLCIIMLQALMCYGNWLFNVPRVLHYSASLKKRIFLCEDIHETIINFLYHIRIFDWWPV